MANAMPPAAESGTPHADPYLLLVARLIDIHGNTGVDHCPVCRVPEPCDTMRALWAYDIARKGGAA